MGQWPTLASRDRDQRIVAVVTMQRCKITDVLPSMHRRQSAIDQVCEERKVKTVEMKVKNIELMGMFADLGEHGQMSGYVPGQLSVETQSHVSAGDQMCPRIAICARKQHHLVASLHESVAQVRDDALGPTI